MQGLTDANSMLYGFRYKSGILEIIDLKANQKRQWIGKSAKDISRDAWIAIYGANIAWGMRGFAFDSFCQKILNDSKIAVDI